MDFFNIIKEVISKPKDFFVNIKKEKGIKNAFIYFIIFAAITSFLSALYFYKVFPKIKIPQMIELTPALILGIMVLFFILILLFSVASVFAVSAITHLFVLWMKGKNEFYQTFKALIYGNTPKYILSIILSPIYLTIYPKFFGIKQITPEFFAWLVPMSVLGIAVAVYTIYLKTIAIKKLQEISAFRAFSAVFLLPLALFIIVYVIFIAVLIAVRL